MSFKNLLLSSVLTVILGSSPCVFAHDGGNSDGGGGPDTVSAGALKLMIEGPALKRAMSNYLATIQLDKVEDLAVRATLARIMGNLQTDLNKSTYYEASKDQPCVDEFNNSVPASTHIGQIGAGVCFDIPKLVSAYKDYSEEEVMIHLAGLAFHEHVHHFQTPSRDLGQIQKLEDEANRVGGYILITAKFVQVPVLEWAPNAKNDQFTQIRQLYDQIQAKERAFLTVKAKDYADFPDYLGKDDRGLFRILPREVYDGKLSISGSGAYYSFTRRMNDYQDGQIGLEQKALSTGFGGCDFGLFLDLGNTPLDLVNLQTPGVPFLAQFMPVDKNEPKVRMQQAAADVGVHKGGFFYVNRVDKIAPGQTYALRTIHFDQSDILVALQIARIKKDGSLIIAWKKLKSFPISACSGDWVAPKPDISGGQAH